jgi:hypothetical protein
MRRLMFRAAYGSLFVAIFVFLPKAASAQACCSVTAIDQRSGIVSAKENATGRAFQFKVGDGKLLGSLRLGQAVYANFKTNQISLDGKTACCSIVAGSAGSGEQRPESKSTVKPTAASKGGEPQPTPDTRLPEGTTEGAIRGLTAATPPASAPVPAGQACCAITGLDVGSGTASARAAAMGQTFTFTVGDRKLLGSLKIGQPVYANFKTNQVSLDGRNACCSIVSGPSGGAQTRSQSTSQGPPQTSSSSGGGISVPGGVVAPGSVNRPVLPYPDIAGEQEPMQYVVRNRSSVVSARFQNIGAEIPGDSTAMDPRPTWYVNGQARPPDDAAISVVRRGRPAWPTLAERSYTANFTLPQGSHQVRAVMPVMPGEQNPANNAATIPVTSGEAELAAQYDEKFIDSGDAGSYWRFRFWAQNTGDIPATCGMRLDFYDRSSFQNPDPNKQEPWNLKGTVTDTITVAPGGKSEYFFVQLRYNGFFSDPTKLPQAARQYRFALTVDEGNVVVEENKANNKLEDLTLRAGADSLNWGKNPW